MTALVPSIKMLAPLPIVVTALAPVRLRVPAPDACQVPPVSVLPETCEMLPETVNIPEVTCTVPRLLSEPLKVMTFAPLLRDRVAADWLVNAGANDTAPFTVVSKMPPLRLVKVPVPA